MAHRARWKLGYDVALFSVATLVACRSHDDPRPPPSAPSADAADAAAPGAGVAEAVARKGVRVRTLGYTLAKKDDGSVWELGSDVDHAGRWCRPEERPEYRNARAFVPGPYYDGFVSPEGTFTLHTRSSITGFHGGKGEPDPDLHDVIDGALSFWTLALKSDGTVWWRYGRDLGQILGIDGIVALRSGPSHALALRSDGALWAWGTNDKGQLGRPVDPAVDKVPPWNDPRPVEPHPALPCRAQSAPCHPPAPIPGLTSVSAMAAAEHTVALKTDGTVWTLGANDHGQLGDGTTRSRAVPGQVRGLPPAVAVAAGYWSTAVLAADGTVWAFGANADGELDDSTTADALTPVQVRGLRDVVAVSAGRTMIAVKADGTVWQWGSVHGPRGNVAQPPAAVPGINLFGGAEPPASSDPSGCPGSAAPPAEAEPPRLPETPPPSRPLPTLPAALAATPAACDAGDLGACVKLGEALYAGREVTEDAQRAAWLFRRACDGGNPSGCVDLGWAHAAGKGVGKDGAVAAIFFGKACDGAATIGCFGLGVLYRDGNGVGASAARAADLFKKACEGGVKVACAEAKSTAR